LFVLVAGVLSAVVGMLDAFDVISVRAPSWVWLALAILFTASFTLLVLWLSGTRRKRNGSTTDELTPDRLRQLVARASRPATTSTSDVSAEDAAMNLALHRISDEMSRRSGKSVVISGRAWDRLEEIHAEYLADVGQEAVRLARRAGLCVVDESHVDHAGSRIAVGISRRTAVEKATSVFGGILAGVGIAAIHAIMYREGEPNPAELTTALGITGVSAVFLTVNLMLTFGTRAR
jgi:hypothetical protein